jgi:hypothetical protein
MANTANGSSEVIGMGIGSKTHQRAHSKVMLATIFICILVSNRCKSIKRELAKIGPSQRKSLLRSYIK